MGKWWHDPVLLAERVREAGSYAELSRQTGVPASTLKSAGAAGPKQEKPAPPEVTPIDETEMLRQRVSELERWVNMGRREDVLRERMIQCLQQQVQAKQPVYKPPARKAGGSQTDHEFALLWSDTHAGEIVDREETNGLNEYDWRTMMERHTRIRDAVMSYKENRPYPVRVLHVWALGDMLSGNIHEELSETNEFPVIECAIQLGLDAAEWLESFLDGFEEIRFAGVVGNHPRLKRKQPSKHRYDNFDWLVYHTMRERLRAYPQISWEIPKAQKWPVMVCGRRVLLFHGDGIRSTMTDVPWGGIIRYVTKLSNQYAKAGKPVDHFVCGHYHEPNAVKNRRILMNGSVKGVDEYSIDAFGGGEPPTQLLTTFHPGRGLTDVSFLDL